MKLVRPSKRWLRRVLSSGKRRPTSRRNGFVRSLQVEGLEGRALLAAVSWIAVGDGNWNTAANWSPPGIPGASDDVTISPASAATITISSGTAPIKSLTTGSNATLSITGGSLTVAADSTLSGGLTMTGGSLTASGAGTDLIVSGSTSVSGASLYANAGATLSLPNLDSYTQTNGMTFQASGGGSVLNLSGVTSLGTMSSGWYVRAVSGGTVDLSGLTTIDQPNAGPRFEANGVNSVLNLTALTSLTGNYNGFLSVTNGASLQAPLLTSFASIDVTIDGTVTVPTSQWASMTGGGSLTVQGGSYSLANLVNVDNSSLYVQGGGTLTLPSLTSYTQSSNMTFQASGASSVLDLSALTSLGTMSSDWYVKALSGGTVNLSGLTTISQPNSGPRFEANGVNSVLNLTALTSLTGNYNGFLSVTNSATLQAPLLTTFTSIDVVLDGTVTVATSQWASLTGGGSLTVQGGSYSLANLVNVDNSSLYVLGGGTLTLPGLTNYTEASNTVFQASGASSVLNLSALTSLGTMSSDWYVKALSGGTVNLSGLTTISQPNAGPRFEANGVNSVLNLTALTSLTGNYNGFLSVTNSASLQAPLLTGFASIDVTIDGTVTVPTSQWASMTGGGSLTVQGGSYSLANLVNVDNSSLYVQGGGSLTLPGLTTYTQTTGTTFQASGTSSQLDLSALTSLGAMSNDWYVKALSRGTVNLSGLTTINQPNSGPRFTADDAGVLNLSKLTSFAGNYNGSLTVTDLATLQAPVLTSFANIDVTIDGSVAGTVDTSLWASLTGGGSLTIEDGSYSLAALTNVDSSSLYVQGGGSLTLPNVTNYTKTTGTTFQASGASSVLSLPALTSLGTMSNTWYVKAVLGGRVNLPGLTTINQPAAGVQLSSDGHNSVLHMPALTTFNANSIFSAVTVSNTGTLNVAGVAVTMPSSGTGATINVPSVPGIPITLYSNGTFTGGTTFNIAAGDTVFLSRGTYNGGTTFHLGAGAKVTPSGSKFTGGVHFDVGAGATFDLAGQESATYSGTLAASGTGTVQLSNASFVVGLGGATLNFTGNMFQWTGGTFATGAGDLTNLGTMNLTGHGTKTVANSGTLDNFGLMIQSGTGNLNLHAEPTTLMIEPGASYILNSDSGLYADYTNSVLNQGTIAKRGGTGTSTLFFHSNGTLSNTGMIEVDSGTLALAPTFLTQLSGHTLTGGTWRASGGATLKFPTGTAITANAATIALSGTGASINGIAGLATNNGGFALTDGANFTTAGDFTNTGSVTTGAGSTLTVAGNFTQTSAGTLHEEIGGTPASGLFGRVPVTGTATLAGTFDLDLVNGFTPSGGQAFQVMSFASANGTFTAFTGLGSDFTALQNPTDLLLIGASVSGIDLQPTSVTAPTAAISGQDITVDWQVSNLGTEAATGSWLDSVYVSTTPAITSRSILLDAVQHSGGLAVGGTYAGSLTTALPSLSPGYYYILVQVDSHYQVADGERTNNILSATSGQIQVSVPALTLGTPQGGAFTDANQDRYYQVSVPAGGTLQVSLVSAAESGGVALYVSEGTMPTTYSCQYAAKVANQPHQTLTVPQVLSAGTYYILAHSVSGAAATAGFTLAATQTTSLAVTGLGATSGGNAGNVTVEIGGANFTPDITAGLTLGSQTITAAAIDYVSASQIFATFNLTGATVGSYTLSVQQGAQSATAPVPFQVTTASTGTLDVTLTTPEVVRAGRTAPIVITYTNPTSNDMVAPLLEISSTNGFIFFSTPDNPNNYRRTTQVLAVATTGPAGILRPGESGQLTLTLLSNSAIDGDGIPVNVDLIQAGQTIDWAAQQGVLKPQSFSWAAWEAIWDNLLPGLGTTTDSYNAALAEAATYLSGLGETSVQVSNVSRLWSFLVAQANASFPTATLTSVVDASLPTPGSLTLAVDRTFMSTIAGRYDSGIFGQGWATSWEMHLRTDGAGNVTIESGGGLAHFIRKPNGSFLSTDGVFGTLTKAGDVYTLTSTSGTRYVFLANGLLNYVQDTNGNRITLGYSFVAPSFKNRLTTLTYSNPSQPSQPTEQLTLTYNDQGLISQVADGTGHSYTYAYDADDRLLSVTAPGNLVTAYTYDTTSNPKTQHALLTITAPSGLQQQFVYDSQGRLSGTSSNGGTNPITYTYGGQGAVTATDAAANQTTVWFNELGLASRVEDARGGISGYSYDVNGQLVGYADAAGNRYQYAYDSRGNLVEMVNPLSQMLSLTYSSLSDLTSLTDAAGNTMSYARDSAGNLLSITYPDGSQESFTYDPVGNLSETIKQNGHPIAYQYNAQGLVSQVTFADATRQTFAYGAHGNLTTAQTYSSGGALTGTTTLAYNAASQLLSITYPSGQHLDFTYDAATGLRTKSVDQDLFTINYSYDALGRLWKLIDGSDSLIVQYTYNNLGQLTEKLNGNGTYTTYAYDATGNLTSEVNYAGGTTVNSSFTYAYNLRGDRTSMTDAAGQVTAYAYDAVGQLTQVTLPGGQSIVYVYNAAGNRTQVINNGTPTAYASNSVNEITQVGSAVYAYDANGNLHTVTEGGNTTTYTYNDLDQLVSITAAGGSVTTFQYSPLGFLVGTSVDGTPTNGYLVDPTGLGDVVGSYDGGGSLIAHYTHGLGLVRQTGSGGAGYYDFDASGNAIGITGASGAYVNQYSYLPFGETTTVSATLPNPFTFAGQVGVMQIGTNLSYMRMRDYSPATGQFLSNDPIGLAGGDANLRRYVGNNPVTWVDPFGLLAGAALDAGSAAAGGSSLGGDLAAGYAAGAKGDTGGATASALSVTGGVVSMAGPQVAGPVGGTLALAAASKNIGNQFSNFLGNPAFGNPGVPGSGAASGSSKGKNSIDPNALIGPAGIGPQHFIVPGGVWSYTIQFENYGSVAAQEVTITEQLDANLDWSTFQLGSFGFGPLSVPVPAGLTQYQTTVSYQNTDGSSLNVVVTLDCSVQTGLLTVTYISLDPLTGQAPDGVDDGFLPPNDSTHVGEGFVQYTIQPKTGLAIGTAINQQALIVFDINAPIPTNTFLNTIDGAVVNQVLFNAQTGLLIVGGTAAADTIVLAPAGKGATATLQVTLNKAVISKTIPLSSIQHIRVLGQEGNDTITVSNLNVPILVEGRDGDDTIALTNLGGLVTVDGGAGTDKLTVTGRTTANAFSLNATALTVNGVVDDFSNLESLTVNGAGGADTFTVAALPAIPVTLSGGKGADRLQGPDVANNWAITAANKGTLDTTLSFVNIPNLTGGSNDDTFSFSPRAKLAGKIDGGGGSSDAISYAGYGAAVTVNLQTRAATGTAGFASIESFVGNATPGAKADTMVGANQANQWNITGPNAGTLNGTAFDGFENLTGGLLADTFSVLGNGSVSGKIDGGKGTAAFNYLVGPDQATVWALAGTNAGKLNATAFANIQNLTGGAQADAFVFAKGAKVLGRIDGGDGRNRLDYSLYGKSVVVDLSTGTATGTAGIAHIQDVTGSTAKDTLTGNDQDNVLLGGGGDDTLTGNDGRDLLFGGDGLDTVSGGLGEDLIFNGRTTFDTNWAVLDALRVYWTGGLSFAERTQQLAAGTTGVAGLPKLDASTITNDNFVDKLTGGADAADWFFAKATDPLDQLVDFLAGVDRVN
jgi:RHS repeat-associated protein/uncharacterized repeat protein (TIGR01451 family)